MERRQYLGAAAAGGVVGVAGVSAYTVLGSGGNDGPPAMVEAEFPPYPNSETIERSGSGTGTSEPFELVNEGPTIIDTNVDHSSDDIYNVELRSTTDETVRGVIQARGPFTGRTNVQPVDPGSYELSVLNASGDWEATIYDLPVYEVGTGMEPPFAFADGLDTVVGPIDFGEQSPVEFVFEVDKDSRHRLDLVDRTGAVQESLVQASTAGSRSALRAIGGVGYLDLKSFTTWTLEVIPRTGGVGGNTTNESN
ncbi:hypothetical protein EGH24_10100 [Halonotius terrestris]|uniref:Uncharacterized protein n=1 Tax=Halonotius terrestris TaxID=2487750 RepID=A0A8J8TC72_9EURY|nr:hypothetical protein [Halonotius terrestris]TQQ79834.1 hypothetical protein EGH24_10100 [Halonotius terrestris]